MSALNVYSSQRSDNAVDDEFTPVPHLTGVVTCPALKTYFLGIVASRDLLCCIQCPRLTLLNLSTCAQHYKREHTVPGTRVPKKEIVRICERYNVYKGLLEEYPRPTWPTAPLPFLPEEDAYLCLLCEAEGKEYMGVKEETCERHYRGNHRESSTPFDQSLLRITAQAFTPAYYTGRRWFRVQPNAHALEQVDEETGVLPASPSDLLAAFIQNWTPAALVRPSPDTLKEAMPFLYHSGFAQHLEGEDARALRELVSKPKIGDALRELYDATVTCFKVEQTKLGSIPEPIRLSLTDEGHGYPDARAFRALLDESRPDYANTLALWCVFVCRMHLNVEEDRSRYKTVLTENQKRAVGWALDFANKKENRASISRVIGLLAQAFWSPDYADDFDYMVEDQFDDPTMRFAVLMCLRDDGMVMSPRSCANELVRIKYAIRLGTLMWARDSCKKHKRSFNE
ncbi:hypothetical protein FRC06_003684 [Ceratobasidium sp. 370]|nr:hypothetical protein FRC06_003684 [Ceratobasidium sp. 370]